MSQGRGYVHRVDIRAGIDEVWRALIDPAVLARWHVPKVRVDARVGGSYWTRLDAHTVREAHIDVFQPPRRLRLIYMPQPGLPDEGGVCVDDFLLDQEAGSAGAHKPPLTIVRLMGSGIPDAREWDTLYMRLRNGWERALLRLKVSFERREEPPVGRHREVPAAAAPPKEKTKEKMDDFIQWPEPTPAKKS